MGAEGLVLLMKFGGQGESSLLLLHLPERGTIQGLTHGGNLIEFFF